MLHELRAYLDYNGIKGSLGYWATPSGNEVDFVWWRGQRLVAIEAKHGRQYRAEYRKGIQSLEAARKAESYVVYLGDRELEVDGTHVLPFESFARRLYSGEILG